MQKYCLGCGVEIIEGAAYCGACGVATTGTDSIGEDSPPQSEKPISPLIVWGIAAVLIVCFIYGFTYYKQNSSTVDGGEVPAASLSGQTESLGSVNDTVRSSADNEVNPCDKIAGSWLGTFGHSVNLESDGDLFIVSYYTNGSLHDRGHYECSNGRIYDFRYVKSSDQLFQAGGQYFSRQ